MKKKKAMVVEKKKVTIEKEKPKSKLMGREHFMEVQKKLVKGGKKK